MLDKQNIVIIQNSVSRNNEIMMTFSLCKVNTLISCELLNENTVTLDNDKFMKPNAWYMLILKKYFLLNVEKGCCLF